MKLCPRGSDFLMYSRPLNNAGLRGAAHPTPFGCHSKSQYNLRQPSRKDMQHPNHGLNTQDISFSSHKTAQEHKLCPCLKEKVYCIGKKHPCLKLCFCYIKKPYPHVAFQNCDTSVTNDNC